MIELNKLDKYIISKKDKIQISSKDIKKGDIFLALKGKRFHGNKFISEAIDKGVGGKEAAKYTGKRFVEGVLNLPDLVASGAKFAKDKAQGKDTKFKTALLNFNLYLLKYTRPFLPPFFRLIAPARWANQRLTRNPNLSFKDKSKLL